MNITLDTNFAFSKRGERYYEQSKVHCGVES